MRWREHSGGGGCSTPVSIPTLEDLAQAKRRAPSYVSGIPRLTLLAPEVVEAILDGQQPVKLQQDHLLTGFPLAWERQRRRLSEPWHL